MVSFWALLVCAALVGADMLSRALRIRLLVSGVGGGLSLKDALRLNLLGDAAAEVTPFRIAGEPSRVYGLVQSGVRAESAVLAVGAELVLSYAMVALLVVAASSAALPAWWSSISPALQRAAAHMPTWAPAVVAMAIASSLLLVSRLTAATGPRLAGIRASLRALGGIGVRHLAATFGLSGVSIAARLGILWMLVSALPGAAPASTVLVGSFVLLFGQAFSPTPSGVGVVELGVLGGAAGPLGEHAVAVLLYWRAYTALLPIVLAAAFALPRFGMKPVVAMLGLRRRASALAVLEVVEPTGAPVLTPSE